MIARSARVLFPTALLVAALSIPPPAAASDGAFLVADLDGTPTSGNGTHLFERVELGGVLFFIAATPQHGVELWRSDGTAAGTRLVRDLRPGPAGSSPTGLTVFGDRVFFLADDGVFGAELWSTDGSDAGTFLVRDVCPGPCSSAVQGFVERLAVLEGRLYWSADDGVAGEELWSTDGSRAGTRRVRDLCPGDCGSRPRQLLVAGSRLFFVTAAPGDVNDLWVTDGTSGGTSRLVAGCQSCAPVAAFGDEILFARNVFELGLEPWWSDGTAAGTRLLADLCPGICDGFSHVAAHAVFRDRLYFTGQSREEDRRYLYRTDGTDADLILGGARSRHEEIFALTVMDDRLYFLGHGEFVSGHRRELWSTDGTLAGTLRVIGHPSAAERQDFSELVVNDGLLYLVRESSELWVSDGTAAGSARLLELPTGLHGRRTLWNLTPAGERVFFAGLRPEEGFELWASAGTAGSTDLVRDVHFDPGSSSPRPVVAWRGGVVFGARDDLDAVGVWRSNGTEAGTEAVGVGPETAEELFAFSGELLYTAEAGGEGGLWATDGTGAGTRLVAPGPVAARGFTASGDQIFFSAFTGETGHELWVTDLTAAGTFEVMDILPGFLPSLPPPPLSSFPRELVPWDSGVLFVADGPDAGPGLWFSDGTEAGTAPVVDDLCPGPCGADPSDLIRFGDRVFFVADDGVAGRELWATDGTAAGTARLVDLAPGPAGSNPHGLRVLGDGLFFFARIDGVGEGLWRSDGTAAGTELVADLATAGFPTWVTEVLRVDERLYFVAANEATGPELWTSDGTAAGTLLVREIRPGPNGSYPEHLTAIDGVVTMSASDAAHGREPWASDGTAAGTRLLADVEPGTASSMPREFAAAGKGLFFQATTAAGSELYLLRRSLVNPDPCRFGRGLRCFRAPAAPATLAPRDR